MRPATPPRRRRRLLSKIIFGIAVPVLFVYFLVKGLWRPAERQGRRIKGGVA